MEILYNDVQLHGSGGLVAKSCPTHNPIDYSLPGSSVHGISQARILKWLPLPSPGDLPNPGAEPGSPVLPADALLTEPSAKPMKVHTFS